MACSLQKQKPKAAGGIHLQPAFATKEATAAGRHAKAPSTAAHVRLEFADEGRGTSAVTQRRRRLPELAHSERVAPRRGEWQVRRR